MNENSKRSILAYSLPIFNKDILQQIGQFGEHYPIYQLLYNNILIKTFKYRGSVIPLTSV